MCVNLDDILARKRVRRFEVTDHRFIQKIAGRRIMDVVKVKDVGLRFE